MAYSENPKNMVQISGFVATSVNDIADIFYSSEKIYLYDACSFQRHSNIKDNELQILINYFLEHRTSIFISRCIIMELASDSQLLRNEYIEYLRKLYDAGIKIVVFFEENISDVLSICFSSTKIINERLVDSLLSADSSVSVVKKTIEEDEILKSSVYIKRSARSSDFYHRFFSLARNNKEKRDSLGEELLGICADILSSIPGTPDGKICVLSDDRPGAEKISTILQNTRKYHDNAKIILYSTPKLIQHIYKENKEMTLEEMTKLLSSGVNGNIRIMGTTEYDIRINDKISLSPEKLASKIMEPNGIHIVF